MTNRVAIGCSRTRDYAFSLPIAALMWRQIVGFEPCLLLTGHYDDWETPNRNLVVIKALLDFEFDYHYVGRVEGLEDHTVAQNCRQYACALPYPNLDYLILSDADLWVFSKPWIERRWPDAIMTSWYSNGDHGQSLPTCHLGATVGTWRELMSVTPDGDIAGQMREPLLNWLKENQNRNPDKNMTIWCMDQWRTTDRIKTMPWWPGGVQQIERSGHPPIDRLDRNNWPSEYNIANFIDAHIFKAPDSHPEDGNGNANNWPRLLSLIHRVLPGYSSWAQKYRDDFVSGY